MVAINPDDIRELWAKAENVFAYFHSLKDNWPLIKHLSQDIQEIENEAKRLKVFDHILILGIGGSSLGGQALTSLIPYQDKVHFIDNIDSHTFSKLLNKFDPTKTGVVAISKSGNTAETLMQLITLLQTWPSFNPTAQACVITENTNNGLKEVANTYNIPCLDHPCDVGGRFSVFTVVGLLPALICGLDAKAFCKGALEAFESALQSTPQTCAPLAGALMQVAFQKQGVNQSVVFSYCDRLLKTCHWLAQLWAESLGKKDEKGTSVGTSLIAALGTTDQHSQLQLYLDGPRDKFFTFLTLEEQTPLTPINTQMFKHPSLQSLHGHTMGQLMIAEQTATLHVMQKSNCPLRQIQMKNLDEANLGSIMMHFMLETLAAAQFWNVNPFDQPAVEEGKILALHYLKS